MSERGWRFCGTSKVDKLFSKDLGKFEEILVIIISIIIIFCLCLSDLVFNKQLFRIQELSYDSPTVLINLVIRNNNYGINELINFIIINLFSFT